MGEATRIDIPELLVLGGNVTEIGARFGQAIAGISSWERSAPGAVPGSLTGDSQIAITAGDWRATLTRLAGSIQEFGDSLTRTAADYWSADTQAAERVHRSGEAAPR